MLEERRSGQSWLSSMIAFRLYQWLIVGCLVSLVNISQACSATCEMHDLKIAISSLLVLARLKRNKTFPCYDVDLLSIVQNYELQSADLTDFASCPFSKERGSKQFPESGIPFSLSPVG
jgi:hypothetical protein